MNLYASIHSLFGAVPEMALFISLTLGYAVGRVPIGRFRLGSVAGTLFVAVLVSQFGVKINDMVQYLLFTLFIFAVGFSSGPAFFRSFVQRAGREIALALVMAGSGLLTVLAVARLFGFGKGLAAGIAAGGLTQSAILGTAESTIRGLGLSPEVAGRQVADISAGYGVTYIFGSFGAILLCVLLVPRVMGRNLRDDAAVAEAAMLSHGQGFGRDKQLAVPLLLGRVFDAGPAAGKTVADIERVGGSHGAKAQSGHLNGVTVERIVRRNGGQNGDQNETVQVTPETVFQAGDVVLVIGPHAGILAARALFGNELPSRPGLESGIRNRDIVVANENVQGKTVGEVLASVSPSMRHGVYLVSMARSGGSLPAEADTVVAYGDVVTLYGAEPDIKRMADALGYFVTQGTKTDFVYMGFGLAFGLLLGRLGLTVGQAHVTLGSCGVLFSGLLFGWFRTRHPHVGAFPSGAVRLLKDVGLAGFVAVVGLNHGLEAMGTLADHGVGIFVAGVLVTLIPFVLTLAVARRMLGYDNSALLAGALAGARSSGPALGEVLEKAENTAPATPFAVTYALANVFLTLLGPLVVLLA